MHIYFDSASLIWDEAHFNANLSQYYDLIPELIEFYNFSNEGLAEICTHAESIFAVIEYFPCSAILDKNRDFHSFTTLTYSFVSRLMSSATIDASAVNETIRANPNFILSNTNPIIRQLLKISASYIYENSENLSAIYNHTIPTNSSLELIRDGNPRLVAIINSATKLEKLRNADRLWYEPSPKHHHLTGWGSRLMLTDIDEVQSLLDLSVEADQGSARYSYHRESDTYIAFRVTLNNIYHAYPIDEREVPALVLRELRD